MPQKSNFEKVKEFNRKFNLCENESIILDPDEKDIKSIDLGIELIHEEYEEVLYEYDNFLIHFLKNGGKISKKKWKSFIKNVSKEISDLLYVVYGFADRLGLPADEIFEEVHNSNMSKLGDDGKPIYSKKGKVLKSSNYKKPNLNKFIK